MTTHRNMMMHALTVAVVVIGNAAYLRSEPDIKATPSKSHAVPVEPSLGENLPVDELNASHDGTNLAQDERGLTADRRIHSWPPFHVVTNALEIMTDLVEARCVLLVGEYRRRSSAGRVDWNMIIANAELRRSILTEELRSMLYPIPFGASWDDAADVMVGLLNGTRREACAMTRGISGTIAPWQELPYSDIVPTWMSIQERQLFLVAQARMQSILTDVFADIALEFESAGDAKTGGPVSSFLSFMGLKNDGWGRPFLFESTVKVTSLGADGIKGTSDDLVLQCTTSNASLLYNGESRDSESYGRRGILWESGSALKITNGIIDSECKVDIERFSNFYVHAAAEGGEISGNDEAELYLRGVRDPCELFVRTFEEMGMLTFPPGSFMRCDRANSKILIRNTAKNSEIIHRILADFTPGREHPLPAPFDECSSNDAAVIQPKE